MNYNKTGNNVFFIFFFLTIAAYLFFGFSHLSKFVVADEHYWVYERIPKYWKAFAERKINRTSVSDKPGITVALISGIGLLFDENPASHKIANNENLDIYEIARTEKINNYFRIPIILFNCGLSIFIFWLLRKIFNRWIALWSFMLMLLSPVLLGISQIINPDSLLWSFSAAAIFSYLALLKKNEKKCLVITSIFTGFCLLTKYVASILFPFFLFLLLFFPVSNPDILKEQKNYLFKQTINYIVMVIGALLMLAVFLPAVFFKPSYFYNLILGFGHMDIVTGIIVIICSIVFIEKIFVKKNYLEKTLIFLNKHRSFFAVILLCVLFIFLILIFGRNFIDRWSLFENVPFDTEKIKDLIREKPYLKINLFDNVLLEFNPLVFSLTLISIFFIILFWVKYIFSSKDKSVFFYAVTLTFFTVAYYGAAAMVGLIATVRYSIMMYPLYALLSALGAWSLYGYFKKSYLKIVITVLIFIFSFWELWQVKPFYFNYSNPLLPKKYLISGAWGYGGYEAAEFINSQPNSEKIIVWTDYFGVCPFIKGICITSRKFDVRKYKVDYYVLTRRGEMRYAFKMIWSNDSKNTFHDAYNYYKKNSPDWELIINNRPENYIKIFKSDNSNN